MSAVTTSTNPPILIDAPPSPAIPLKKIIAPHIDTPYIKWIDNPDRIKRAMRLLYTDTKQEYVYNSLIQVPKSTATRETIPLPLEFNFNIDSLLTRCISALKQEGFPVKAKVFKGGAIHYVMDGFPATLRDFDISLVIDPPKGDPFSQWQKINAIILRCLEEEAGLIVTLTPDKRSFSYSSHNEKVSVEMPIIFTRDGYPKISLFEHVGGLENFWWWGRKPEVREEGEEYALFSIPAQPHRVELEVVATHKNSATCSLDALRLHYSYDENGEAITWMSATDNYDVHKACSLRRKRIFYCHPERIPTIREGLLRYCSHLLKGFLPTELSYEANFCKAFFNDELSLKLFPESLQNYLKCHTSSKEDRIRYLLNMDAIMGRYKDVADDKKLIQRSIIAQFLYKELGLDKILKPDEIPFEMQLMRDYLYLNLSKNRFYHSYGSREFCCVDDPKGREFGAFVMETPKPESLNQYLEMTLNSCLSLNALSAILPHAESNIDTFFRNILQPKIEKTEEKEAAPPTFPDFSTFLVYLDKNPKLHLKKCAKYLQNLFSFKVATLNSLTHEQKILVKNALDKTLDLLKQKEKSRVVSIFIEAFKSNIFNIEETEENALKLVKELLSPYSEKEFKDAVKICQIVISNPKTSYKTLKTLFQDLLNTPANPKPILELFAEMNFDPSNAPIQEEIWDSAFKKISSDPKFHPLFMILWRHWNNFCADRSDENVFLITLIDKYIDITTRMLSVSKDPNVLYWVHEIASTSTSPLLAPIKRICLEYEKKWIIDGDQKIVYYYRQYEHILLREASEEHFIGIFSSVIRGAFPCKDNVELTTLAIKRGIEHIMTKAWSSDSANIILKHLERQTKQDKSFPAILRSSLKALSKYANPPTVEDRFTSQALNGLKIRFIENKDSEALNEFIDLFKVLSEKPTIEFKSIYEQALEVLEECMVLTEPGNSLKIEKLSNILCDILKQNLSRIDDKLLFMSYIDNIEAIKATNESKRKKIVVSKKMDLAESTDLHTVDQWIQATKHIPLTYFDELLAKYEPFLKENPDGNADVLSLLICIYEIKKDWKNLLFCTEKYKCFALTPKNIAKNCLFESMAHRELGDVTKELIAYSLSILAFIISINQPDPPSSDEINEMKRTLEALVKNLSAHKDFETLKKPLDNLSKTLKLALIISKGKAPVGFKKELIQRILEDLFPLEKDCIRLGYWNSRISCLNLLRPFLSKPEEIALNLANTGICYDLQNQWHKGLPMIINAFNQFPLNENLQTYMELSIANFLKVRSQLSKEKLKCLKSISVIDPKINTITAFLRARLKAFSAFQKE